MPLGDPPPPIDTQILPQTGWSVVVALYAGQTLVWQEVDSEHGILELGTVAHEIADKAAAWTQENAVAIEQAYPDANAGPLPSPPPPIY